MTKDDLLAAMARECDLCVHLHGKVPPGGMEFRLTPAQRSTAELLRYLSYSGIGISRSLLAGSFDPYHALAKEAESLAPAGFPAAMERQKGALRDLFAGLSGADYAAKPVAQPWGTTRPLGAALVEFPYATLVAYRMQLFLQAKAAGNGALSTANCWGGRDAAS